MNASTSLLPAILGGLPLAALYSLLLITLRQRFGGTGIVVGAGVAVLAMVGFVAPQAFRAEHDHPFLVVAFVVILFVALFATPAFLLWRIGRANPPTVGKQVLYGVLGFYGGMLLGAFAAVALIFVRGRAV